VKQSIILVAASLGPGGTERSITTLANKFNEMGLKVTIISAFKSEIHYKISDSIKVVVPPYRKSRFYFYFVFKTFFYLRQSIKKENSNVVLSMNDWINPIVVLSTRFLNKRVYVSERISPTRKLGLIHKFLKRISYPFVHGFISQTTFAKDILSKTIDEKLITIIPNAVKKYNFEKIDFLKKRNIISVGRLSPEKGHNILIQAFAGLKTKEWELHLIGDGIMRNNLELLASKLGVEDIVFFHGFKKDFNNLLLEAEIFVLPSLSEGFPNALLEAMSLSLACVSTNCIAGPSEIISHGVNGLLVKPGDVLELKNALKLLIEDDALRKKISNNASSVTTKYDLHIIAHNYLKFLFPKLEME
jgi:GalNAc-alpha-(1->4)-GalNAc-alpha-(1->3)-diNAcBac-PP-undecaprenol alpha-1,4-N-acetyl-D-galactosaminyltransferase